MTSRGMGGSRSGAGLSKGGSRKRVLAKNG